MKDSNKNATCTKMPILLRIISIHEFLIVLCILYLKFYNSENTA